MKGQELFVTISTVLGGVLLASAVILFAATISGTILYWIYPHIFAMFPNAGKAGVLAPKLGWWDAVCICWIFQLLIKSSGSSSDKKKEDK